MSISAPLRSASPFHETTETTETTREWEQRVGSQVRSLRIGAGHDQATLASLADVSVTSIKNLENGRGSTLRTLIRVVRALGAAGWLDTLAPTPTVSPIDLLRSSESAPRQRVSRPRASEPAAGTDTPPTLPAPEPSDS